MLLKMNNVVAAIILIILLSFMGTLPPTASTSSPVAKPGCQSRCGNVTIPYPFGIGSADCFYNKWYQIICKDERPYIHINQDGVEPNEVLNIGIPHVWMITIRSSTSNMRLCEDTSQLLGANLTGTPFFYSSNLLNKFMFVGCGTATLFYTSSEEEIPKKNGCTSDCDSRKGLIDGCYGINCCQVSDIYDVTEFKIEFSKSVSAKNSCGSAFIVDNNWYPENASLFSDPSVDLFNISVPLWLGWRISQPIPGFENNKYCHQFVYGWYCDCPCGFSGNPYIHDGCQGDVSVAGDVESWGRRLQFRVRDRDYDCSESFLAVARNLKSIIGFRQVFPMMPEDVFEENILKIYVMEVSLDISDYICKLQNKFAEVLGCRIQN